MEWTVEKRKEFEEACESCPNLGCKQTGVPSHETDSCKLEQLGKEVENNA